MSQAESLLKSCRKFSFVADQESPGLISGNGPILKVMMELLRLRYGPLSMLIAPANVTRRMEIKFSRGAVPGMGHILVIARCVERDDRWLTLEAAAHSPQGELLARAKATHWVLEQGGEHG
jgi:hypothetical protein